MYSKPHFSTLPGRKHSSYREARAESRILHFFYPPHSSREAAVQTISSLNNAAPNYRPKSLVIKVPSFGLAETRHQVYASKELNTCIQCNAPALAH